jgi:hypothetical protein
LVECAHTIPPPVPIGSGGYFLCYAKKRIGIIGFCVKRIGLLRYTICMTVFLLSILRIRSVAEGLPETVVKQIRPWLFGVLGFLVIGAVWLHSNAGGGAAYNPSAPLAEKVIHRHEQFHFYFGAKYFEQIRYDGLYDATYLAYRENRIIPSGADIEVRDPLTFTLQSATSRESQQKAVRSRFTYAEWQDFTRDIALFTANTSTQQNLSYVTDHGNTGSPLWAAVARPFVASTIPTDGVLIFLATLDWVLLFCALVLVARWIGFVPAGVAAITILTMPLVNGYLTGSFLRYDWLVALLVGIAGLHRKNYATAGIACAYAVLSRIFPIVFPFVIVTWFLAQYIGGKCKLQSEYLQGLRKFSLGFIGMVVIGVGLSGATLGFDRWQEYAGRTRATVQESFYPLHYAASFPLTQIADTELSTVISDGLIPQQFSRAEQSAREAAQPLILFFQAIVFVWAIWSISRAATALQATVYALPLLFSFAILNVYYYVVLGVFMAAYLAQKNTSPIHAQIVLALIAVGYLLYHYAAIGSLGYALSLLGLIWLCVTIATDIGRSILPIVRQRQKTKG